MLDGVGYRIILISNEGSPRPPYIIGLYCRASFPRTTDSKTCPTFTANAGVHHTLLWELGHCQWNQTETGVVTMQGSPQWTDPREDPGEDPGGGGSRI